MDKFQQMQVELAELRSKYNAEKGRYDTRYTRKAILVALGAGFIFGFVVKAMIF